MSQEAEDSKYKFYMIEADDRHKMPLIHLNGNQQFFPYGQRNDYCDYLIQLYNRSSVHSTIVKNKCKFVVGKGWDIEGDPDTTTQAKIAAFLAKPNRTGQDANDILERITMDMELFNGFALEVVWSVLGPKPVIKSVYHKDWSSLRVDRDQKGVWESRQWTEQQSIRRWVATSWNMLPIDAKFIPFFNPETVGPKEYRQIYYFKVYNAQQKPYPYPEYLSCNTDIETDIEISNYDLNNIKTGFAAGTMVTLFNGQPSDDETRQIEKDLKGKVAGTDNAGQILLNFQNEGSTPVKIDSFRPNDLADQYFELKLRVRDAIFVGHQVNNPMLFGIQVEGKLGGRTELVEAYEQFQNVYVNARQQAIERVFNTVLSYHIDNDSGKVKIIPTEPLGMSFTEQTMLAVLPKAALADIIAGKMGIDLSKYAPEVAAPANSAFADEKKKDKHLDPDDDEEILALFAACGQPDTGQGDTFECDITCSEDAEAFERRFSFARVPTLVITDPLRILYDALKADPTITLAKLAEKLATPQLQVIKMLNDLQRLNVLDYETDKVSGKVTVKRIGEIAKTVTEEEGFKVTVKYKYTGPKDSKNRPFCAQMLRLNRIYSRAEIDAISEKVGYSVWLRRGGWYRDPTTDVSRPSCRHFWSQVVIKERV